MKEALDDVNGLIVNSCLIFISNYIDIFNMVMLVDL